MLINATELLARLGAGEQFALIDVREQAEWRQNTLPGACHLNVYDYFIPDSSNDGSDRMVAAFHHAWQQLQLSDNVTYVFFEQQTGMRSPRALWFTQVANIGNALLLDGGLDAWRAAGGKLVPGVGNGAIVSTEHVSDIARPALNRHLVATRDEVIAADRRQTVLLDARRPTEYSGAFAHPCCQRAGRIPGSRLLFWEDVIHNGHYLPAAEIGRRAQAAGLSPAQRVIIYCHRGARAATVMLALQLAGYHQLAIYVGSWHEWAEHTELPLLRGV